VASFNWLRHPLTKDLSIDDPRTTVLRREIVRSKPFLRKIYGEWYRLLRESLPGGPGLVLELGSGAGFLSEAVPEAITSEVFLSPGIRLAADAQRLPVEPDSLRAIAMVDVFHHLPDCGLFLREAARCVRPGGAVVAIEPWVTSWSRFVYRHLHHEPFFPGASEWRFPATGPLSGANGALPWIVFERDRRLVERDYPQWRIERVHPFMPFLYLLSGGVGDRSLAPSWMYPLAVGFERLVEPAMGRLAMFAHIVLRRSDVPSA
jgi:SAM-dependent methyltransferase